MLAVFVASHHNFNLIDTHFDKQNIKKLSGDTFSIEDFIKRNMQLYSQCTELILEREVFKESDEEFAEWLRHFHFIYTARITIIYENAHIEKSNFIKELIKGNIFNVVTGVEVKEINEQFSLCFSDGMDLSYWEKIFPELIEKEEIQQEVVYKTDYNKAKQVTS